MTRLNGGLQNDRPAFGGDPSPDILCDEKFDHRQQSALASSHQRRFFNSHSSRIACGTCFEEKKGDARVTVLASQEEGTGLSAHVDGMSFLDQDLCDLKVPQSASDHQGVSFGEGF